MQPLVSVIIPVYCVEKYITACVQSVLCQTYQQLEVILVDDGSPDGSGGICDAFAAADARVKVIHMQNSGPSAARNAGILAACGEYVMFLDADDLWNREDAIQRLMERQLQVNADVLNFSYICWQEESNRMQPYFQELPAMPALPTKKEQLDYLTQRGLYIASACNKLIRSSLLKKIPFRTGVRAEDIEWCANLMVQAWSMDFVCENFYLYRQHSQSSRHTATQQKCRDLTDNILSCIELAKSADDACAAPLARYTAFQFATFFILQAQADAVPNQCIRLLAPHCRILTHHGKNKKLMLLHGMCNLLGYQTTCALIRKFYRKRGM